MLWKLYSSVVRNGAPHVPLPLTTTIAVLSIKHSISSTSGDVQLLNHSYGIQRSFREARNTCQRWLCVVVGRLGQWHAATPEQAVTYSAPHWHNNRTKNSWCAIVFSAPWTGYTSPRCTVGRVNPSNSAFYQSKGRVPGWVYTMVVGDTRSPRFVKPGALIRIWGPRTLELPLVANPDP